jgi:hypothetical protein
VKLSFWSIKSLFMTVASTVEAYPIAASATTECGVRAAPQMLGYVAALDTGSEIMGAKRLASAGVRPA